MKCLIQQPVLAPYRLKVFQALAADPDLNVQFAASPVAATGETSSEAESTLAHKSLRYLRLPVGFVWQAGLWSWARATSPDVLVVGYDPHYLSSMYAAVRARRRGTSVVMWGHGLHEASRPLARWLYARLAGMADALVFYAESGANACIAGGQPREKVFVAWNSIDTSGVEDHRRPVDFEDRHRIVLLGRLTTGKKPLLAVRAFAHACEQLRSDTLLTIIGDGEEREVCEAEAKRLGIEDRTEFPGATYDDGELARYMNEAWVSLSTGYVGLSAIHSLAFGVPMLFARNEKHSPEVCALVVGENSLDFESDSVDDLAQKLILLNGDRHRCATMGSKGIETVKTRFSVEAMVQTLTTAFRYAAHRRKSGA